MYGGIPVFFTTDCEKAAFHQRNAAVVLSQKLFGQISAGLGVLAVVIGTNVLGVAGSQHRAAYHDFAIQLGSVQGLDGGLHVGHGGR